MLSWEAGGNPADGVWAPYWYGNVHRSTGFVPYRPKSEPFPAELEEVFAVCSRRIMKPSTAEMRLCREWVVGCQRNGYQLSIISCQ